MSTPKNSNLKTNIHSVIGCFILIFSLGLTACSTPPKPLPSNPVPDTPSAPTVVTTTPSIVNETLRALPNWNQDPILEAWPALLNSCQKIGQRPTWKAFCQAVQMPPSTHDEARALLEQYLTATLVIDPTPAANRNIATAYFEPIYSASLYPIGDYQWPLYAAPVPATNLARKDLTPANGTIHPILQGKELAYLNNPIDAFLAHIQGSVQLKLINGSILRLGFAGKNNQPYQSIANTLIAQGVFKAEQASMERIKAWANTQPATAVQSVLNTNPSFIFFKPIQLPPEAGAIGALGVSLTPMRSIAVDTNYIPLGSPVWLETQTMKGLLSQMMVAQDTGSAIKGASRVDIYTGTGDLAGKLASAQKSPAKVWLLTPKSPPP
jgi:membrane-bound lytic murein transglycosylase A